MGERKKDGAFECLFLLLWTRDFWFPIFSSGRKIECDVARFVGFHARQVSYDVGSRPNTAFACYRQKVPPHSVSDTTSPTQLAVDAVRSLTTSKSRPARRAVILVRRCASTTGASRLRDVAQKELAACVT